MGGVADRDGRSAIEFACKSADLPRSDPPTQNTTRAKSEAREALGPRHASMITEMVTQLQRTKSLTVREWIFDPAKSWLLNATEEYQRAALHQRAAFRAIVANETLGQAYVLDAETNFEDDPLWDVDEGLYPLDPTVVVPKMSLLLRASAQVLIIDPYFNFGDPGMRSWLLAIAQELGKTCAGVQKLRLDVHFSDRGPTYEYNKREAKTLGRQLSAATTLTLHCYLATNLFHARNILTEVGGVKLDNSLHASEQETQFGRVSEPDRKRLWDKYVSSTPPFREVGPPFVVAGSRRPRAAA